MMIILGVLAAILNVATIGTAIIGAFLILGLILSLFRGTKPDIQWYEYSYPFTTVWYILTLSNSEGYVPPMVLSILALFGVIIFIVDSIKSKFAKSK